MLIHSLSGKTSFQCSINNHQGGNAVNAFATHSCKKKMGRRKYFLETICKTAVVLITLFFSQIYWSFGSNCSLPGVVILDHKLIKTQTFLFWDKTIEL